MNNVGSFMIGLTIGAAAGIGGALLYSNKKTEEYLIEIDDLIQENEALRRGSKPTNKNNESEDEESEEVEDEDETIKKYHHYKSATNETAQSVFEKKLVEEEISKVTEGQKAIKENPELENHIEGIEEIAEEDLEKYEEDDNYSLVYLDYFFNNDSLIWGSGTDNETLAEAKFKSGREALIGQFWRWATDYIDEDTGTGMLYVLNKNLNKIFEVTIHFDPNEEVTEVD